jgi:cytochrome o ubiquinol oxidase subunit 2
MAKTHKLLLGGLLAVAAVIAVAVYLQGHDIAVLNPKGTIAHKELRLIVFGSLLSLVVVIPVFVMTFWIAWTYREGNTKARYSPDWDHSRLAESIWWAVPMLLILILSVVTWLSSRALDPFRDLESHTKPMTIQVVALDWKWLFIYPEQDIATVNFVQFPAGMPVDFEITADAPMNSFWIPQLGGQIYAMSGMSTHLHLMADAPGDFRGSSANISGRGFAGMKFTARASSETDFKRWVNGVKQSPTPLSRVTYSQLARPSENAPLTQYAGTEPDLYNLIVMKYMVPGISGVGAL